MSAGAQRHAVATPSGPGLPAAIFDFSRGKQALLTIAQPALGAVLALAGLPSWRVIAIGLPAACAASFALYALNDLLDRQVDARALAVGKSAVPAHDVDTAFVRHPLASGVLSLRLSVAWVGGLITVAVVGLSRSLAHAPERQSRRNGRIVADSSVLSVPARAGARSDTQ